ncbi:EamA family transporter RarD [Leucobacter sp. M11]|uniref:EamA family transporter RarD n=1 Tax=Leucobacter sp. M11 TaxID=2993565 RepID=UPI002D7F479E|nr:EamA family transporter RarD [Leucobacter sp. M11]MEB4614069.1 EamA family transporter RarD [Leucobacter sp. M11]
MTTSASNPKGVAYSVVASVMFGGLYFLTPLLAPLDAITVWALRIAFAIPCIAIVLFSLRQWPQVAELGRRVRTRPVIILGLLLSGGLLAVQLWLFAWAPLNGRGLQVALGYFLLPLSLVVIGRFLYRDRLAWWQWLAAGIAALGVAAELIRVGGISWETLVVCLGYPVYFVLRRSLGWNHLAGQFWEMSLWAPVAVALIVIELASGTALAENPMLWWFAPALSFAAAFALIFFILASRLLPMSTFGLLSYLEPALLMVAALLIGETIAPEEFLTYGAVWAAALLVVTGGITEAVRGLRKQP